VQKKLDFDVVVKEMCIKAVKEGLTIYNPEELPTRQIGKWKVNYNPFRLKYEKVAHTHLIRPVYEPYDESKINFIDILKRAKEEDPRRIYLEITIQKQPVYVILHYQPTQTLHFMIIPNPQAKWPQFLTQEIVMFLVKIFTLNKNSSLKIGFHSWATAASINHLHFQGWYSEEPWLIEKEKKKALFNIEKITVSTLPYYPARVIVFSGKNQTLLFQFTFLTVQLLQKENIGHIVMFTKNNHYIWPQSYTNLTGLFPFGFGVYQMGGHPTVISQEVLDNITEFEIEKSIAAANINGRLFDRLIEKLSIQLQSYFTQRSSSSARLNENNRINKIIKQLPDYPKLAKKQNIPYFDGGARYGKSSYTPSIWELVKCPLCGANSYKILYYVFLNRIVKCKNCKMIYTNPRAVEDPDDYYNFARYEGLVSIPDIDTSTESYRGQQQADFIIRYLKRYHKTSLYKMFLDIGCGFGFTLYHLHNKYNWPIEKLIGVELSSKAAKIGRDKLGINILAGDITTQYFEDNKFDIIFMGETIEHIRFIQEFMKEVKRIL
jgi:hypothetical protein